MGLRSRGSAAFRAERLCLSGEAYLMIRGYASNLGHSLELVVALDGKPKAFRTEGGKAACLSL